MKKFLIGILVSIMLLTPLFSGLNEHTYPIFNDWVYDDYNEGDWVAFDLGALDGSLDNKQSFVRITLEITDCISNPYNYIVLYVREHGENYKTNRAADLAYFENAKVEVECWTDGEGWIDYKFFCPIPEAEKIQIMMRIINSVN